MRERDLKPGDASAMAKCFAIFHAALTISDYGTDMPLTRRGKRLQQLAFDDFKRKSKR